MKLMLINGEIKNQNGWIMLKTMCKAMDDITRFSMKDCLFLARLDWKQFYFLKNRTT